MKIGILGAGGIAVQMAKTVAGMKDVEIQLYSGDRHEILNEKDRKRVFEKIADWMAKRE